MDTNNKPFQREGFGPPLTNGDMFKAEDIDVKLVISKGTTHALIWHKGYHTAELVLPAAMRCINPDCEREHTWE